MVLPTGQARSKVIQAEASDSWPFTMALPWQKHSRPGRGAGQIQGRSQSHHGDIEHATRLISGCNLRVQHKRENP